MMLCGCRKSGTRANNRPQGALVHQLLAEHTLAQLLTGTNVERYYYSQDPSVNSWLLSTYNVDMKKLGGTMAWWEASDMRPSGPNPSLPSGVSYKTPSQLFGYVVVLVHLVFPVVVRLEGAPHQMLMERWVTHRLRKVSVVGDPFVMQHPIGGWPVNRRGTLD